MEEEKIRKQILEQFESLQEGTRTAEVRVSLRTIARLLNRLALNDRRNSKSMAQLRADLNSLWLSQQQFISLNQTNGGTDAAWQSFFRSVRMLKENFLKITEQ